MNQSHTELAAHMALVDLYRMAPSIQREEIRAQVEASARALESPEQVQGEACELCNGTHEVFSHADDCSDDLCALNGDEHSCEGKVDPCSCAPTPPTAPAQDAQGEAAELLAWFAEAGGFNQGTKAPHKWVLRAEQELRRLAALRASSPAEPKGGA